MQWKTVIQYTAYSLKRTSSGFDVLDDTGCSARHCQASQVPGARAGGSTAAVNFDAVGRATDCNCVGTRESDTFDYYTSSGCTKRRRIALVDDHSELSDTTGGVPAVNDVLDDRSGCHSISLDPQSLDTVGDVVRGNGDTVNGRGRGDRSYGDSMPTGASVTGEGDVGSSVDG